MTDDRLTLALPIDLARHFDSTTTQANFANNTFAGSSNDRDMLASEIEDAEDEFRVAASVDMRLSRAGSPGDRTTFDQVTYEVPGHERYKREWAGVGGDYLDEEVTKNLSNARVLPFDPDEGDEAYIYRGLSGSGGTGTEWEDVTDEYGDLWAIVNHRHGTLAFSPLEIDRAMSNRSFGLGVGRSNLRQLRFAVSYRYGALGGGRGSPGQTSLGAELAESDGADVTLSVEDATRLPTTGGGSVVVLIGQEYVRVTVDAGADEITVQERGVRGTEATAHDADARVQYTPPAVRKAVSARAAMQLIQSSRYYSWLPDSEGDLDQGDVLDELEQTWDATIEAFS